MVVGILTEKESAAKNFAKALGGMKGTYDGVSYVICHASGHLFEFVSPEKMVPPSKQDQVKSWDLSELPWDYDSFTWKREMRDSSKKSLLSQLESTLNDVDEIALACDVDPSGEGDLIAWEIIDHLNLHHKKFSRMEFTDEAVPSIQSAFTSRRPITSMNDEGEYRKAEFRSRFDLFTMQSVRTATKVLETTGRRAVLYNGRLKSAIIQLVGDGLAAHNNWVKKPFYSARYRDDAGVVYTDPEAKTYPKAADVPGGLGLGTVVKDSEKKGSTAPPKLLDLSDLSSILSRKGFGPKIVLSTYQKMYEAQVVSYPRTEDQFVSPAQFDELLPLVDKIAGVVGIDPGKLTRRSPRKSHVKDGGAHGANRPGPNVPDSLDSVASSYGKVGAAIYDILARNYLTMLAEDYEYLTHYGHIAEHPQFTGSVAVPQVMGWKDIFVRDDDDEDDTDDAVVTGLGCTAEPFVHEGFPPRPKHPSQKWLMAQLKRAGVGTGATRTSTYADMLANPQKAQLVERKNKTTLTELGQMNYQLLAGTHIGDLGLTTKVQEQMAHIAAGELDIDTPMRSIAEWISEDITTMTKNAAGIDAEMGKSFMSDYAVKEKAFGTYVDGREVKFSREFSGHRFTDDEVADLLAGKDIRIKVTFKSGTSKEITGRLEDYEFKGRKIFGFRADFDADNHVGTVGGRTARIPKVWGANQHWSGHEFTDDEVAKLFAGETVEFEAVSRKGPDKKYTAKGKIMESEYQGKKRFGFNLLPFDK